MTRSLGYALAICSALAVPDAYAQSSDASGPSPLPTVAAEGQGASLTSESASVAPVSEPVAKVVEPLAGAKPVYPEFTFKRISVPKFNGQKRITVQIDPSVQERMLASVMPEPEHPIPSGGADPEVVPGPPGIAAGSYAWYWNEISPRLAESDGRFSKALVALTQGPSGSTVVAPRLQYLQGIAAKHGTDILNATIGTNVSPALVLAMISVESGGKSDAVSSSGAVGLMQLIPATADRFAVDDSADPVQNIKGGVAYLDWLMKEFDRDPLMVIAAYNAGENAVKSNGGVPPFAETRDYVPKVLAAWAVARGLCITPPELVTDGCVFAVKG